MILTHFQRSKSIKAAVKKSRPAGVAFHSESRGKSKEDADRGFVAWPSCARNLNRDTKKGSAKEDRKALVTSKGKGVVVASEEEENPRR